MEHVSWSLQNCLDSHRGKLSRCNDKETIGSGLRRPALDMDLLKDTSITGCKYNMQLWIHTDWTSLLKELYVGRRCNILLGRESVSITIKIIDTYSGSKWNIPIIIWGDWTDQIINTNKWRKLRTDIEVRTHAGHMCCVFRYEPHDDLSKLT